MPHFWHFLYGKRITNGLSGFLACRDYNAALRYSAEQSDDVRWLHHFEKLVRSIIFQSANSRRCVIESYAFILQESNYLFQTKGLIGFIDKVILVTKEGKALYSPVVITLIRIEEITTPALSLRWETTEKQHLTSIWQEWMQWMILYAIF